MAIEIREYIGSNNNIQETVINSSISLSESLVNNDPTDPSSLTVDIEGIHVGPTRNYTWYTEQALASSVPSWTKPYLRPLIMHHNEKDGKIIGRIQNALYVDKNTRSGTAALVFTANVPDEDGKKQILDGRLKTVSIGVIAHDVRCSICGEQITEVFEDGSANCGHSKGANYEGKTCYWMIYSMEAKELSYVIVPSDPYAHNLKIYNSQNKVGLKESNKEGVLNLSEQTKPVIETKESQVIDETVAPEVKEVTPAVETKAEGDAKDKEIEDLKLKLYAASEEKGKLIKDLESANKTLVTANADLAKIQGDLTAKASELQGEVALREAAENEVVTIKTQLRESVINNVMDLRSVLNKQIVTREELAKRSEDSINDSLRDLKEEISGVSAVKNITEAANPSLDTEKIEKPEVKNVKESKTTGNINLEEGLKDLMSDFFKTKSY